MLKKIIELVDETGLSFHNKFRLELRPPSFYDKDIIHQLWQLRMNIDPVTWFDFKWRECHNNEEKQRDCLAKVRLSLYFQICVELSFVLTFS